MCEQLACFMAANTLVIRLDINPWEQLKICIKFYFTFLFKKSNTQCNSNVHSNTNLHKPVTFLLNSSFPVSFLHKCLFYQRFISTFQWKTKHLDMIPATEWFKKYLPTLYRDQTMSSQKGIHWAEPQCSAQIYSFIV